jgi:hypothetical protein
MSTIVSAAEQTADWTLNLQVFLYLQVLDTLTTWLGLRIGLAEASPFIQVLMHFGPLTGLFASKLLAFGLGGVCVWRQKFKVLRLINYWYAGLVVWNLSLILSR